MASPKNMQRSIIRPNCVEIYVDSYEVGVPIRPVDDVLMEVDAVKVSDVTKFRPNIRPEVVHGIAVNSRPQPLRDPMSGIPQTNLW